MDRTGSFLEAAARKYGKPEFLPTDPLEIVRRYGDDRDREAAGFLVALVSYGRVRAIRAHAEELLACFGDRPGRALRDFDPVRELPRFLPLRYRFHTGPDLVALAGAYRFAVDRGGSLEDLFLQGGGDVRARLTRLSRRLRAAARRALPGGGEGELSRGLRFLLASPERGGACKRWNLFLRWMVRRDDGIDLGVWRRVDPAELIVPLDAHLNRIGARLGLVEGGAPDWRRAERLTASLRRYDPADPLRFDFPLCRLGILDRCPAEGYLAGCGACELFPLCEKITQEEEEKIR